MSASTMWVSEEEAKGESLRGPAGEDRTSVPEQFPEILNPSESNPLIHQVFPPGFYKTNELEALLTTSGSDSAQ